MRKIFCFIWIMLIFFFCTTYDNITLIGDFNMIPENQNLSEMNKFEHLILKPICLRGLLPSTIDLLLTNHQSLWDRMCMKQVSQTTTQDDQLGSKENLC